MSKTSYPGIDYGLGMSNIDSETGIRYGVICIHALEQHAIEAFEADYGDPACPKCGEEVIDSSDEEVPEEDRNDRDYYCPHCEKTFWSDACYGEDPNGWVLDEEDCKAFLDEHNDVMLVKSPYFTYAQFCSPCAPGAGHLENPCQDGPRTFCFGPTWFANDTPPYDVYEVSTGNLICKAGERFVP